MSHPTSHPVSTFRRTESAGSGVSAAPRRAKTPSAVRPISPVVRNAIVYPVRVQVSPPGFVHDFQI